MKLVRHVPNKGEWCSEACASPTSLVGPHGRLDGDVLMTWELEIKMHCKSL